MTTILDGVMFVDGSLASQSVLLAGNAELILRGQDALVADQPTATVGSASLTNLQRRSTGVEAGIDMPAIVTDSGTWVLGLALGVTDLNARFAVDGGTARISGTGLSMTGAATWYGQRGAYVDVQGRISRITADLRASDTELAEGESLTGQAASSEVGQEIVIGQGQSLLPHLRLGHARLSGDAFADSTGMLVDPGTHRSTNARIGATWQQTLDAGGAVFVTGHLDHDFNPVTRISVGADDRRTEAPARTGFVAMMQRHLRRWSGMIMRGSICRTAVERALGHAVPSVGALAQALGQSRLAAQLRSQFIHLAERMEDLDPGERGFLLHQTAELALYSLSRLRFAGGTGVRERAALFTAAQRHIDRHLTQIDLDSNRLAAALGTSRATLYRLFR